MHGGRVETSHDYNNILLITQYGYRMYNLHVLISHRFRETHKKYIFLNIRLQFASTEFYKSRNLKCYFTFLSLSFTNE